MSIVFLDCGSLMANTRQTLPADVVERLAGAQIAITNKVRLDAGTLDRLPELRMIAFAATGTDVIDLAACRRHGIVVSNTREYATASVPEHTFALILALRRNLLQYHADVRAGMAIMRDRIQEFALQEMGGARGRTSRAHQDDLQLAWGSLRLLDG